MGDEARCSNAQILTMFVSTPIASDITHGFVAPTQINPDMHLDLDARSIGARIADALGKAASGLPCSSKPQGDPLVSTWHVCQCLDNALTSSMGLGLLQFQPPLEQVTLLEAGQRGRYSRTIDGRWTLTVDTEDGPVRRWLLPSPNSQENPSYRCVVDSSVRQSPLECQIVVESMPATVIYNRLGSWEAGGSHYRECRPIPHLLLVRFSLPRQHFPPDAHPQP